MYDLSNFTSLIFNFMHTVFVNDKPLSFVDSYQGEAWKGNTASIFVAEADMQVEDAVNALEETKNHPGIVYMSVNPDISWQLFISYCELSEAAGGLVKNQKGENLIIFRHGKWDLPKGKLEYDETPAVAALREVREECGAERLEIVKSLDKTFHTYYIKKKRILKKTHWFLMKSEDEKLIPQTDEDIEQAVWMTNEEVKKKVFMNTYASIKELLQNELKV
jgi:ADP-ribose pyrophosphatase YjhB (NUDIX family)